MHNELHVYTDRASKKVNYRFFRAKDLKGCLQFFKQETMQHRHSFPCLVKEEMRRVNWQGIAIKQSCQRSSEVQALFPEEHVDMEPTE